MAWFRCKFLKKKDTTVYRKVVFPGSKNYIDVETYIGDTLDSTVRVTSTPSSYPYYKVGKLSIRWRSNLSAWYFYCNENALEFNGSRVPQSTNWFTNKNNSFQGSLTVKEIE